MRIFYYIKKYYFKIKNLQTKQTHELIYPDKKINEYKNSSYSIKHFKIEYKK